MGTSLLPFHENCPWPAFAWPFLGLSWCLINYALRGGIQFKAAEIIMGLVLPCECVVWQHWGAGWLSNTRLWVWDDLGCSMPCSCLGRITLLKTLSVHHQDLKGRNPIQIICISGSGSDMGADSADTNPGMSCVTSIGACFSISCKAIQGNVHRLWLVVL